MYGARRPRPAAQEAGVISTNPLAFLHNETGARHAHADVDVDGHGGRTGLTAQLECLWQLSEMQKEQQRQYQHNNNDNQPKRFTTHANNSITQKKRQTEKLVTAADTNKDQQKQRFKIASLDFFDHFSHGESIERRRRKRRKDVSSTEGGRMMGEEENEDGEGMQQQQQGILFTPAESDVDTAPADATIISSTPDPEQHKNHVGEDDDDDADMLLLLSPTSENNETKKKVEENNELLNDSPSPTRSSGHASSLQLSGSSPYDALNDVGGSGESGGADGGVTAKSYANRWKVPNQIKNKNNNNNSSNNHRKRYQKGEKEKSEVPAVQSSSSILEQYSRALIGEWGSQKGGGGEEGHSVDNDMRQRLASYFPPEHFDDLHQGEQPLPPAAVVETASVSPSRPSLDSVRPSSMRNQSDVATDGAVKESKRRSPARPSSSRFTAHAVMQQPQQRDGESPLKVTKSGKKVETFLPVGGSKLNRRLLQALLAAADEGDDLFDVGQLPSRDGKIVEVKQRQVKKDEPAQPQPAALRHFSSTSAARTVSPLTPLRTPGGVPLVPSNQPDEERGAANTKEEEDTRDDESVQRNKDGKGEHDDLVTTAEADVDATGTSPPPAIRGASQRLDVPLRGAFTAAVPHRVAPSTTAATSSAENDDGEVQPESSSSPVMMAEEANAIHSQTQSEEATAEAARLREEAVKGAPFLGFHVLSRMVPGATTTTVVLRATNIRRGGPADIAGLRVSDRIISLNNEAITSLDAFRALVRSTARVGESFRLTVGRHHQHHPQQQQQSDDDNNNSGGDDGRENVFSLDIRALTTDERFTSLPDLFFDLNGSPGVLSDSPSSAALQQPQQQGGVLLPAVADGINGVMAATTGSPLPPRPVPARGWVGRPGDSSPDTSKLATALSKFEQHGGPSTSDGGDDEGTLSTANVVNGAAGSQGRIAVRIPPPPQGRPTSVPTPAPTPTPRPTSAAEAGAPSEQRQQQSKRPKAKDRCGCALQ